MKHLAFQFKIPLSFLATMLNLPSYEMVFQLIQNYR